MSKQTGLKSYLKDLSDITSLLDKGPEKAIVLYGDEDYFLSAGCRAIQHQWSKKTQNQGSNHETDAAIKSGMSDFFEASGLFSQTSLHIFKRAEKAKKLPGILAKITPATVNNHLVFVFHSAKSPAAVNKALKNIYGQDPALLACKPIKDYELSSFCQMIAKKKKLDLTPDAINQLVLAIGNNPSGISNALEKLSLEFHDKKVAITGDTIQGSVAVMREDHAFKLTDLMISGQKNAAHLLVHDLLNRGSEPLSLLGIIFRHVKLAQQFKSGTPPKVHPFVQKKYAPYAKKISSENLKEAVRLIQSADHSLKSSSSVPSTLMFAEIVDQL